MTRRGTIAELHRYEQLCMLWLERTWQDSYAATRTAREHVEQTLLALDTGGAVPLGMLLEAVGIRFAEARNWMGTPGEQDFAEGTDRLVGALSVHPRAPRDVDNLLARWQHGRLARVDALEALAARYGEAAQLEALLLVPARRARGALPQEQRAPSSLMERLRRMTIGRRHSR